MEALQLFADLHNRVAEIQTNGSFCSCLTCFNLLPAIQEITQLLHRIMNYEPDTSSICEAKIPVILQYLSSTLWCTKHPIWKENATLVFEHYLIKLLGWNPDAVFTLRENHLSLRNHTPWLNCFETPNTPCLSTQCLFDMKHFVMALAVRFSLPPESPFPNIVNCGITPRCFLYDYMSPSNVTEIQGWIVLPHYSLSLDQCPPLDWLQLSVLHDRLREALHLLHFHQWIHRQLQPSCILLMRDSIGNLDMNSVVVSDLHLCAMFHDKTNLQPVWLTPPWRFPVESEMERELPGDHAYAHAKNGGIIGNWWSLGIILLRELYRSLGRSWKEPSSILSYQEYIRSLEYEHLEVPPQAQPLLQEICKYLHHSIPPCPLPLRQNALQGPPIPPDDRFSPFLLDQSHLNVEVSDIAEHIYHEMHELKGFDIDMLWIHHLPLWKPLWGKDALWHMLAHCLLYIATCLHNPETISIEGDVHWETYFYTCAGLHDLLPHILLSFRSMYTKARKEAQHHKEKVEEIKEIPKELPPNISSPSHEDEYFLVNE